MLRTPRIGPVTYRQLVSRFGSAGEALQALPELAARGRGKAPRPCDPTTAEAEADRVDAAGARYVGLGDDDYPPLLAQCDDAPPLLTVCGHIELFARPSVSIVGARNASAIGLRFARELAGAIGDEGRVVVSGLARGIDASAHIGSMASGTIAVIAGGIDVVYPRQHETLQAEVAEKGLLVAEMPPGTEPQARHFPNRNRIIAGLTAGTIVVEAAVRSGSLITARLAGEMGREVMAVPGHPLDQRADGCNKLIREGATLVRGASDVEDCLGSIDRRMERVASGRDLFEGFDEVEEVPASVVEGLLGPTAVGIDEVIRQSGLSAAQVQLALLELDLAGRLQRHAGGKVSLIPA
nr:DNA-processing protein DprA [Sphingomicrobium sp. B8]